MNLKEILIKKQEIPISKSAGFKMPIHPELLKRELDPNLAQQVFPLVKEEWHKDLQDYIDNNDLDNRTKEWYESAFLREFPPFWIPEVLTNETGFAKSLSISRNGGGTLYFNNNDGSCENFMSLNSDGGFYIKFKKEKLKEFASAVRVDNSDAGTILSYASHNIDYYPGALFLRNWAIAYENEALKSISF